VEKPFTTVPESEGTMHALTADRISEAVFIALSMIPHVPVPAESLKQSE